MLYHPSDVGLLDDDVQMSTVCHVGIAANNRISVVDSVDFFHENFETSELKSAIKVFVMYVRC